MYRIHFDAKTGKFVIQVVKYSLLWVTAMDWQFETYDDAIKHVEKIGLNKLYQDRSANAYNAYMEAV